MADRDNERSVHESSSGDHAGETETPRFQPVTDELPIPVNVGTTWPMTEAEIRDRAPKLAALLAPLLPPGLCEVRALDVGRPNRTATRFSTDPVQLCAEALRLSGRAAGVYYTLGELHPDTPARIKAREQTSTGAADAVRRRWLVLDVDYDRKSGTSATDGEKGEAYAVVVAVREYLRGLGWPDGPLVDSGNGYHAYYRIDLAPDDSPIIAACLEALDARFNTSTEVERIDDKGEVRTEKVPRVKVDTAYALVVPHLLVKFPGTLAAKGANTTDRPHRTGGIVSMPEQVAEVSMDLLVQLAAEIPKEADAPKQETETPTGDPADHPLDDFNARGSWDATGLFRDGWTVHTDFGDGRLYLTRPGKEQGDRQGATIGFSHPDRHGHPTFWAFTSSTAFTPGKAYSKAQVYALLNGYGDHKKGQMDAGAVTKALRAMGYGKPEQKVGFGTGTAGGAKSGGTGAGHGQTGSANGGQQAGTTAKPVLVRLSDVKAEAVRWTWDRRCPCGRLTLICGHPGSSKSVFTMMMAATVSTGGWWPDRTRAPLGDVLLLSSEDGIADTIRPRLDVAGANCDRIVALTGYSLVNSDGEKELALTMANVDIIHDALSQMNRPELVVVDPVGSYLGGGVDAHRDNEVRAVLAPMAALAAKFDVAIVLVAHTTKARQSRADDGILGSRAFSGIVRATHHIGPDPDDTTGKRLLFLPGKNNLGPRMSGLAYRIESAAHPNPEIGNQPVLSFESEPVEMGADDAFGRDGDGGGGGSAGKKPGPDPVKRDAAATWLVSILRHGPQPKAVIDEEGKAAGFTPKTVRNAREFLGVESYKTGLTGCYFWRLPAGFDLSDYPEEGAGCPGPDAEDALVHDNRGNLGKNKHETQGKPEVAPVVENLGNLVTGQPGQPACRPTIGKRPAVEWVEAKLAAGPIPQDVLLADARAAGLTVTAAGLVAAEVYEEGGVRMCRLRGQAAPQPAGPQARAKPKKKRTRAEVEGDLGETDNDRIWWPELLHMLDLNGPMTANRLHELSGYPPTGIVDALGHYRQQGFAEVDDEGVYHLRRSRDHGRNGAGSLLVDTGGTPDLPEGHKEGSSQLLCPPPPATTADDLDELRGMSAGG